MKCSSVFAKGLSPYSLFNILLILVLFFILFPCITSEVRGQSDNTTSENVTPSDNITSENITSSDNVTPEIPPPACKAPLIKGGGRLPPFSRYTSTHNVELADDFSFL